MSSDTATTLVSKELRRYILIVSYDGTQYSGFQRQSSSSSSGTLVPGNPLNNADAKTTNAANSNTDDTNSIATATTASTNDPNSNSKKRKRKIKNRNAVPFTIQETLEDALEFYTGQTRNELRMRFAGRTDGGVHARGQVVVVSLLLEESPQQSEQKTEALWRIRKSINSRLPNDISIEDVSYCNDESFDPRKDAISKQYSYTIRYRELVEGNTICQKGGPHLLRTALDNHSRIWICPWALDDSNLQEYCSLLEGTHDFSAFVHKEARQLRDNVMTVDSIKLEKTKFRGNNNSTGLSVHPTIWEVRFLVQAKGFGRSQVRNMVGFVVDACRGLFRDLETTENHDDDNNWLWKNVDTKALAKRIHSAPACGLCLEHVTYEVPSLYKDHRGIQWVSNYKTCETFNCGGGWQ